MPPHYWQRLVVGSRWKKVKFVRVSFLCHLLAGTVPRVSTAGKTFTSVTPRPQTCVREREGFVRRSLRQISWALIVFVPQEPSGTLRAMLNDPTQRSKGVKGLHWGVGHFCWRGAIWRCPIPLSPPSRFEKAKADILPKLFVNENEGIAFPYWKSGRRVWHGG